MVTAAGAPLVPPDMPDNEILINSWLAEDLQARPGDEFGLSLFGAGRGAPPGGKERDLPRPRHHADGRPGGGPHAHPRVRRGDRVGLWSTNCIEWIMLHMGCARAGAALVNVNPPTGRTSCGSLSRARG